MMLLAPASIACMVLTTRPYTWYLQEKMKYDVYMYVLIFKILLF